MTESSPAVTFESVEKRFGNTIAVRELTLDIPQGSFFALLGPSGCGKTTTLRMVAGFERPNRGEVYIRGQRVTDTPPYRRNFGMVFQNYALFPHMTVAENVAFGLRMRGVSRAEQSTRVRNVLATVKLADFADRYPRQLSGGQQQRVALARAIVTEPDVLLLDEPLGALDKLLREQMQIELRSLQKQLGITTLFVTHDQEEALTMADSIAVMRDGLIEQIGTPLLIYERPKTEFVAGFLGASNFLTGHVEGHRNGHATIEIDGVRIEVPLDDLPASTTVRLAVRPEKLKLRPADATLTNAVRATVTGLVYKGPSTHVMLERDGQPLIAYIQNDAVTDWRPEPGMTVLCEWAPGSAVVLRSA